MLTKRRKAFIIAGVSAFLAVAIVAYLITVPPFGFVRGGRIWLAQIHPTDSSRVVLVYTHDAKPMGIIANAESELKMRPKIEFCEYVEEGSPGSRPYDYRRDQRNFKSQNLPGTKSVGSSLAYFETKDAQITIDAGGRYVAASAMFQRCTEWPQGKTMIAILKPVGLLDRIHIAIFSMSRNSLIESDVEGFASYPASDRAEWDKVVKDLEDRLRERATRPMKRRGGGSVIP